MLKEIENILKENRERTNALFAPFNPITGEGSILDRQDLYLTDYDLPLQWVPVSMFDVSLVQALARAGSIEKYIVEEFHPKDLVQRAELVNLTKELLTRIRYEHDFAFWCAALVKIENKEGGEEIPFCFNQPQRKLATLLEKQRLADKPIRAIILKARQWGGSTLTQVYMAWLQLIHRTGLNSLIIAHVKDTANNIKSMFHRLLMNYPLDMLYSVNDPTPRSLQDMKFMSVFGSRNVHVIPQRQCRIQIGSAEKPETCRGESHMLGHFSEVAMWPNTQEKKPEDLVRSASAGILLRPMTMIVYESTAQRTGDFFHGEWLAAMDGTSQFAPLFVGWWEIEQYRLTIDDLSTFATNLWAGRNSETVKSNREESGKYLWWLWEKGATLEHIAWYVEERKKFTSHEKMAREYPTDDDEAFAHTKANVFSSVDIARLRRTCKPAMMIGELQGRAIDGEACLEDLHFVKDTYGEFMVWDEPEPDVGDEMVLNRYITVVDVGRGMSDSADYSDILVLDRLMTMDGGRTVVVAEWHGHIDIDLLAWKAAQIAKWYNNSLLVIESNTIESNGGVGLNMAYNYMYVLELIGEIYPNMYYRTVGGESQDKGKVTKKIGFFTGGTTKPKIMQELKRVVRECDYVERNEKALVEFAVQEQKPNGSYWAPPGTHDDMLMTRAIGLWVSKYEMEKIRIAKRIQYRRRYVPTNEATI